MYKLFFLATLFLLTSLFIAINHSQISPINTLDYKYIIAKASGKSTIYPFEMVFKKGVRASEIAKYLLKDTNNIYLKFDGK